jgi:hypothetical protein
MGLITDVSLRVKPNLSKVVGNQTLAQLLDIGKAFTWASGVIVDTADKVYYAKPTIGGSATLTLDFSGGLLDIFGDAFVLARLKMLLVLNDVANPNPINVQRPASNGLVLFGAASDLIPVRPGGFLLWGAPDATGIVVTAATGDLLDFVNTAAGNVTPEILAIGASA